MKNNLALIETDAICKGEGNRGAGRGELPSIAGCSTPRLRAGRVWQIIMLSAAIALVGCTHKASTFFVTGDLPSGALVIVTTRQNPLHAGSVANITAQLWFKGGSGPAVQVFSDNANPGRIKMPAGADISFTGTGTARLDTSGTGSHTGILDFENSADHNIIVEPNATLEISAQIQNGGFNVYGDGTLELSGSNTVSMGLCISGSTTLRVTKPASLGPAGSVVSFNGGTLALQSDAAAVTFPAVLAAKATGASMIVSLGRSTPSTTVPIGAFTVDSLALSGGNNSFTVSAGGSLIASKATLSAVNGPGPCNLYTVSDLEITSSITCPNGLVDLDKFDAGQLTLAGSTANNFGNLTVSGGTLLLSKSGNAMAVPGNLLILNGSTVRLTASNQIAARSNITIDGSTGSGQLDLNNCDNTLGSSSGGGLTFQAGGKMSTGTGTALLGGDVAMTGTSTLGDISGKLNLGTSARTFNVAVGSTLTIESVISGGTSSATPALIKTGGGMLYLKGSNTFTGQIVIKAGTVKIDSDANLGTPANKTKVILAGGTLISPPGP